MASPAIKSRADGVHSAPAQIFSSFLSSIIPTRFFAGVAIFAGLFYFPTIGWSQSNPTAQSLPYSQNFGTLTFTSLPAGWVAWLAGGNKTTQALAEASAPTADDTTVTAATASQTTGGIYGYAVSSNAQLYIQESSNATRGTPIVAFAFNTGSSASVTINYDLSMINGGASTQDYGHALQYRAGTSGSFTTITGSAMTFGAVTSYNTTTRSFALTGLTANTVYQIRIITWRPSGSSSSKGIGIDNFSVIASSTSTPTITGAATASAFTTTYGTVSTAQTFPISGSNLTANLVATAPTGFEVSADGSTYGNTATFTQSSGSASGSLRVRLKANAAVSGSYNALNIVLSSTGATSVNIGTAATGNAVSAKALTITANDQTVNAGSALANVPASVSFISSGLANGETIGTVSLGYGGAGAVAGTFPIVPSGATGGSFTASNYSISYANGTLTVSSTPVPTIAYGGETLPALSTTYPSASSSTSFTISGANMVAGIMATAPTGFEVSTDDSSFAASVTVGASGSIGTTTVYVRLSGSTSAGSKSGSVALTSSGATPINVPLASSTVQAKALTGSFTAANKAYDATTSAAVSDRSLTGAVEGDDVTLTGGVATFDTAGAGTGKTVTLTGAALSGIAASNYILGSVSTTTADITKANQTITFGALSAVSNDFNLSASSSSGLSVSFSSSNLGVATVSGNAVTLVGVGTSTITASQLGNENYEAATSVTQELTVSSVPYRLVEGDIAVIGYNTSGTPDSFTILVLKDLNPGTTFYVNDNETSVGGSSFTDLNEVEASFTVKPGQTIAAGTVITLPWGAVAVSDTKYDWSSTTSAGFGNNNEEIYIYTASSITATTPTAFVSAAAIGSSSSGVPTGLTLGQTFIKPQGTAARYKTVGAVYVGAPTVLLAAIGNTANNWEASAPGAITDWTFLTRYPSPTISSISPTSVLRGSGNTPVTFTGTGYSSPETTVSINGSALSLTNVSSNSLTANVTSNYFTTAGTLTMTLSNPAPGGGSVSTNLAVVTPLPTITGLSPASVVAGAGDTLLTVSGTGFFSDSVVRWNGTDLVTSYNSPNQLTTTIPAASLSNTAVASVTVATPDVGGLFQESVVSIFQITAPTVPQVTPSVGTLSGFETSVGTPSAEQSYTLQGQYLSSNVVLTAPAQFQISKTSGSGFGSSLDLTAGEVGAGVTIYVRYNPSAASSSHLGSISHVSGGGAVTQYVALTGNSQPTLSASPTAVSITDYQYVAGDNSGMNGETPSFLVSAARLATAVTVTAPTDYGVSSDGVTFAASVSLTPDSTGLVYIPVYVRFQPLSAVTADESISITAGSLSATVSANGRATGLVDNTLLSDQGGDSQVKLSWASSGYGLKVVVLARLGASISDVPSGVNSLTANSVFGQGSLVGSSFVVYKEDQVVNESTASMKVVVTGLTNGQQYTFKVFVVRGDAVSAGTSVKSIPFGDFSNVLTQWTFNSNPADASTTTGTLAPSTGTGTASVIGLITTASYVGGSATDPLGSAGAATGGNNSSLVYTGPSSGTVADKSAGVQIAVSTVGKKDVVIYWDNRASNAGPKHLRAQYTLDATAATPVWVDYVATTDGLNVANGGLYEAQAGDTWYIRRKADLTAVSGVENNAKFGFRLTASYAPGESGYRKADGTSTSALTYFAGNFRTDMLTVTGASMQAQTPFETWASGYNLTGANAAGTADPDYDGMDNNTEFAFGTSPVSGASRAVTQVSVAGGIKITWLQRIGVTYTVKSTDNLGSAFSGTVSSSPVSPQPGGLGDYQQYEATLTGGERGFLKVEATIP